MSIYARAVIVLAVLAGLAGIAWWDHQRMARADATGYARAQSEYQAAAEVQREGNRGRARDAEQGYTDRSAPRERFIVQTVTEVRNAIAPLALCPVGPDGVRLLNDAARCAREDRPASCGAGEPVPVAR